MLEDSLLAGRRFSGTFDADQPEALIAYLASDRTVAIERQGKRIIRRSLAERPETD